MSSIRPATEPNGDRTAEVAVADAPTDAAARRPGVGRAVAVLVLVTLAALIPLLGPTAALDGTGEAAAPGVAGVALLRTVLFGAVAVQTGEVFLGVLARRVPGAAALLLPRSWSGWAAGAGFVAALGLASAVATGNLVPHRLADIDLGGLYRSRDGALALLEVNAFLVAFLCARSPRAARRMVPLGAVVAAEALRAHPPVENTPLVGSGLTVVHLTCSALWAGGLLQVLRTLRLWRTTAPGAGAALLGLYARVASVLVAVITATGLWSTLRRMPLSSVLDQLVTTAYGRTLLAKVLLVAVACGLAVCARLRLRGGTDPLAACTPARAEVAVLGAVVAMSALLTALPLPIRW